MGFRQWKKHMRSMVTGGMVGASALGAGCYGPNPELMQPRDFYGRLDRAGDGQQTVYATTTPAEEPPPRQQSTASSDANLIATVLDIFSWAAPTPSSQMFLGGMSAYARTEAIIEAQKESARIVRGGLEKLNTAQPPSSGGGVSYSISQEFGRVLLFVAPSFADFNGNNKADLVELQPSPRIPRGSPAQFAFVFEKGRGICNPEMKILNNSGKVMMRDNTWGYSIGYGSSGISPNALSTGRYFFAIFGEIPDPRPNVGQGTRYFVHAIPFEVVDE